LKVEEEEYFNERVKAWFALGSNPSVTAKTVTIGGYEVIREPQINIGFTICMQQTLAQ
jgi:Zn finger protein HypA/HybF involved in hydrogenase expression